jgi:hypothetical protein
VDKVYVERIEFGPTPKETRVFLTGGIQLMGVESLTPHEVSWDKLCKTNIVVVMGKDKRVG